MSDFEDKILRRAIKAFYDGANFESLEKASGSKVKYNQKFFDGYEKELRKGKSPKGEPVDEEVTEIE